jgi:hypothetical protein
VTEDEKVQFLRLRKAEAMGSLLREVHRGSQLLRSVLDTLPPDDPLVVAFHTLERQDHSTEEGEMAWMRRLADLVEWAQRRIV